MAGICVALEERGMDLGLASLKFFISLIAPRYSQPVEMGLFGEASIKLPTWVLYSPKDSIPCTKEFASTLETKVVQEWNGGHRMPDFGAKADIRDSLRSFLNATLSGKLSPKERIDSAAITRAISSKTSGDSPRRMRVLFLHGFSTSGDVLRDSLARLGLQDPGVLEPAVDDSDPDDGLSFWR